MKYDNIINEIDNLNAVEFTMETFKTIGLLSKTISNMYGNAIIENDKNAKIEYEIVKGHLKRTVFDILKKKLGYSDEIINNILCFIDFADSIEEIYVDNNDVAVKLITEGADGKKDSIYSFPNDIYYEVIFDNYDVEKVSSVLNKKVKTKKLK